MSTPIAGATNPSERPSPKPALYIGLILLALVATFVYKIRFEGIFACPANGYGEESYLSDCQANAYGDYDHGAFWFGLEPVARTAVADAEVLFIGNSRMQFAFSNATASDYFSKQGIRYFLLGFSHSETTQFIGPLLQSVRPQAKVYVINVDRFFDDRLSPPTAQILESRDSRTSYEDKRTWQSIHKALCTSVPVVCGHNVAVFRARANGTWGIEGVGGFQKEPVAAGRPSNTERWGDYASIAERFVAQLPVDRACVVLTIVPTVGTKQEEAKAIADRLKLELLAPEVEGLRTFDGSHLDRASAERWAAAFFEKAGPRLRKCLGTNRSLTL